MSDYVYYKRWCKPCPKRVGVSGAWPCVLDEGHIGPHVCSDGQSSTKIYDVSTRSFREGPDVFLSWGDRAKKSEAGR